MSDERIAIQESSSLDKLVAHYARVGSANRTALALGGFLLLFVASRLLYLVSIDPNYLLTLSGEELYCGTIAQELVTGLTLPFTEYSINNYAGGSLVIGVLAAGFFLLFGPTLFGLKLAPLVFFTLALAFWYRTLQQYASERAAGYFAMLFCFSPPLFTAYSVTATGHHSESILFSAATVFLLFRMLSQNKPSLAYPVLLGLISGFGLWFAYVYGLTLLAMLAFWVWHETGKLWRPRMLWFALGFVLGFSPWILINVQTDFAGLVIYEKNVWRHFGLNNLWDGLSNPRRLAIYEFFADIASDDPRDLPRRAINLLYSLVFLAPLVTAAVIRLKAVPSEPTVGKPTRFALESFGTLYAVIFALAVQFSDFKGTQYHLPAYPFLFVLVAYSLAHCQDLVPNLQGKIQIVFVGSVVVLGLVAHAPLLSLDRPGVAISAKGYSYAVLPVTYYDTHTPGWEGRGLSLELSQRPFLSALLPKLSSDDQRDLSRGIAEVLARATSLNGQVEDFAQIERLVPTGFERYFYHQVGLTAMERHPKELPKAVAAVEFLRDRSAEAHHLALVGIYRQWPWVAALDSSPEGLAMTPAAVAQELSPYYWRAIGHLAGRYWYERERSLSQLNGHLQSFLPRFDPPVQRYVLQGVGELLCNHLIDTPWIAAAELERFSHDYQRGLLEGWGMALGEFEYYSNFLGHGPGSPFWKASTKGLSATSLASVEQGKAQFDALFEGRPQPRRSHLEMLVNPGPA